MGSQPADSTVATRSNRRAATVARAAVLAGALVIGIGAGCLNAAPDAKTPLVAIAAVTDAVTEGTQLQFAVRAHPAPAADLAVDISLDTPGCSPGPTTRIVTIAAGAARATFAVSTAVAAGGEGCTVTAAIAAGSGYRVDNRSTSATATLTRGDGGPGSAQTPVVTIAAAPGSVVKGNPAEFILTAAPPPAEPLTVNVAAQEVGSSQTEPRLSKVTIPAGSATATLSADTENDLDAVFVSVLAGTGYGVGSPSYAAKILDNDFVPPRPVPRGGPAPGATPPGGPRHLPEVIVESASYQSVEEGNPARFRVAAPALLDEPLTVYLAVTETGSYVTGTRPSSVTIPAGRPFATFSVDTDDDDTDEPRGKVTAVIRNGTGYTLGSPSSADVNLHDNDPLFTIAATTETVQEGNPVSFTVSASTPPEEPATVQLVWTVTGRFLHPLLPSRVTIPPGSTTATLSVGTIDDGTDESNGTVTVTLVDRRGYAVGSPDAATLTVHDDDAGDEGLEVTIKATTNDLVEEFEGVSFELIASETRDHALTVAVAWQETGSYLTGTLPSTVTIPAGSTTATLSADTDDDDTPEDAGTVTVTVIDGTGYSLGPSSDATLSLYDNDTLPTVSISILPNTVRRGERLHSTAKIDPPFSKLHGSSWTICRACSRVRIYFRIPDAFLSVGVYAGVAYRKWSYLDTLNRPAMWYEIVDKPHYLVGEPSKTTATIVNN